MCNTMLTTKTRKGVTHMTTMTPTALATKLAGADNADRVAKAFVRPYLRRHFARAKDAKGTSWEMNPAQVKAVTAAWKKRQA